MAEPRSPSRARKRALTAWRIFIAGQRWITGMLLVAIILATLGNVAGRYLFSYSLVWADEFSRLAFITLVFLGAALAVASQSHLVVDTLVLKAGERLATPLKVFAHIVAALFFAFLFIGGYRQAFASLEQLTPALQVGIGYVYGVVPVSAVLMALNYLGAQWFGPVRLPTIEIDAQAIADELEHKAAA